ncbi:MAG: peptide ABC transporter substrate-binding protein [Candidatus Dormibacteraeota bacterium]|nr:peptide ABC transporter substrate-binding protein [Candidatus Dormibacteraeota bacterium]
MNRIRFRVLALAALGGIAAFACGGGSSGSTGQTLASDQTLHLSIQDDVGTLDPGHVQSGVDIAFTQQMFSGLYKFDNNLKVQPDIATGMPDISSDGLTYTFHLKSGAKFSNGDPVTSADFLYSWNRAAYLADAYDIVFGPVVGFDDVSNQRAKTLSGLTAPDAHTIKAQLSAPAGYWLTELALWTANALDQKVIGDYTDKNNAKNDSWWTDPTTAIGSGPFKLAARTPKASMDFKPVSGYWAGSTGALTDIKVDIGADATAAVKKFESGGYDNYGFANQSPSISDILRYKGDPTKSKLLTIYPQGRSSWLGFNQVVGPFKGLADGLDGRTSFSHAIDRSQIVNVACGNGATCSAGSGFVLAKGLKGYLGDNSDPLAKFDAAGAKAQYQKWDSTGSKVAGLKLEYNTTSVNDQLYGNVQSQLKANLGINVQLSPSDFPSLIKRRNAKQAILFRDSWGADYDHPQDWFDNLFTCAAGKVGGGGSAGYCNPAVDKLSTQAGQLVDISKAVPIYQQAFQLMIKDAFGATLTYGTQTYLVQSYVQGMGNSSLYDYPWIGIKLLKH